MFDTHFPRKAGHRLTEKGNDLFDQYLDYATEFGCSCHLNPPCGLCSHEGHPFFWSIKKISAKRKKLREERDQLRKELDSAPKILP